MTSTSTSRRAGRTAAEQLPKTQKARKRPCEKLPPALKNGGLAAVTAAANVAAVKSLGGKGNSTRTTTEIRGRSGVEFSPAMPRFNATLPTCILKDEKMVANLGTCWQNHRFGNRVSV